MFSPLLGFWQSILSEKRFALKSYSPSPPNLPHHWPTKCIEPKKLPPCPDFRTQKSNSSNTSSDTPQHSRFERKIKMFNNLIVQISSPIRFWSLTDRGMTPTNRLLGMKVSDGSDTGSRSHEGTRSRKTSTKTTERLISEG